MHTKWPWLVYFVLAAAAGVLVRLPEYWNSFAVGVAVGMAFVAGKILGELK